MSRAFDADELMGRMDNDWEFLAETVEMLAADGPARLADVRRALAAGDAAAVGRSAHALKGMVSNFCAPAAQAAAREVERIGNGGDLATAPAAVDALAVGLGALIADLNAFVATKS
jgi:HPt (histidine-containing phosphotransfer) domain-containing protein